MPLTLNEFVKKYIGVICGNTEANYGECVGLISLWNKNLGLSHIWGNAKDIYTNASTSEHKKIKNSTKVYPNAGDIIIWNSTWGGGFGHIAVVLSSDKDADSFTVFEQNNPLGNPPRIFTYNKWNGVIGWLHPLMLDNNQSLIGIVPEKEDDSCQVALANMTKEKEKYKTRSEGLEINVKDLKKEIEEKNKQYNTLKESMILMEKQKAEALSSAGKYSSDLLVAKNEVRILGEALKVSQNRVLDLTNDISRLLDKDYNYNEIVLILKKYGNKQWQSLLNKK